jgi:hypothetical protein
VGPASLTSRYADFPIRYTITAHGSQPGRPLHGCTVRSQPKAKTEKDSGGFARTAQILEKYEEVMWWKTDLLPEPLRHDSGHEGSHYFITHEFVDAVLKQRKPLVDIHEAVADTAPGSVAHRSALKDGERMKIPQFDATL